MIEVSDEAGFDADLERVTRAEELIEQLRQADEAGYRAAFEQHIQAVARKPRGEQHLPNGVPVTVPFVDWLDRDQAADVKADFFWTVEYNLWGTKRACTSARPTDVCSPLRSFTSAAGPARSA